MTSNRIAFVLCLLLSCGNGAFAQSECLLPPSGPNPGGTSIHIAGLAAQSIFKVYFDQQTPSQIASLAHEQCVLVSGDRFICARSLKGLQYSYECEDIFRKDVPYHILLRGMIGVGN